MPQPVLAARLPEPGAVAAVLGHVHRRTEGVPDVARASTGSEGLIARDVAELGQNEVAEEGAAVGVAELLLHGEAELAGLHRSLHGRDDPDTRCRTTDSGHEKGKETPAGR